VRDLAGPRTARRLRLTTLGTSAETAEEGVVPPAGEALLFQGCFTKHDFRSTDPCFCSTRPLICFIYPRICFIFGAVKHLPCSGGGAAIDQFLQRYERLATDLQWPPAPVPPRPPHPPNPPPPQAFRCEAPKRRIARLSATRAHDPTWWRTASVSIWIINASVIL